MKLSKVRVLMITGWGVGKSPLEPLQQALSDTVDVDVWDIFDPTDQHVFQEKVTAAQHYDVFLGWSLGGQLTLMLANAMAERIGIAKPLICCMSNPCFVQNETWISAMQSDLFQQFSQLMNEQPLRGMQRFCQLVSLGHARGKRRASQRFQQLDLAHIEQQLDYLPLLQQLNLVNMLKNYKGHQLHIFAKDDVLVPHQIVQNSLFLASKLCKVIQVDGAHDVIETEVEDIVWHIKRFITSTLTNPKSIN